MREQSIEICIGLLSVLIIELRNLIIVQRSPSTLAWSSKSYATKILLDTEAPDFGLLDDPDEIVEQNTFVRENGIYGNEWPSSHFIIGHNGCGDYYIILLNTENFKVGFCDHEIMECNTFASSLDEFIENLMIEMEE